MTISGKVKTNQDKIALKCYNMMKSMYKDEYSEIIDMFYGIQVSMLSQQRVHTVILQQNQYYVNQEINKDIEEGMKNTVFEGGYENKE